MNQNPTPAIVVADKWKILAARTFLSNLVDDAHALEVFNTLEHLDSDAEVIDTLNEYGVCIWGVLDNIDPTDVVDMIVDLALYCQKLELVDKPNILE